MTQIITNQTTLIKFQSDWDGVGKMFERMRGIVLVSFAKGKGAVIGVSKVVYNLPVLLAFDVLKNVVQSVRDEGIVVWPNNKLWEGAQLVFHGTTGTN